MTQSRIIFASVLTVSVIVLSACNTVEGFGRDISKAGQAIGDSASETKDRINSQ